MSRLLKTASLLANLPRSGSRKRNKQMRRSRGGSLRREFIPMRGSRSAYDLTPGVPALRGSVDLAREPTVCPDRLLVRLPYTAEYHRTLIATTDHIVFNANSYRDPESTFVGHQPLGFDQWMAFYTKYKIFHYQYEVTVVNTSTTSLSFAVYPANFAPGPGSITDALEYPRAKRLHLGPATGNDIGKLVGSFDIADIAGRSPTEYSADTQYEGTAAADPATLISFHTFAATLDGSNVSYDMVVRVWMVGELYDRVRLSQS